MHKLLNFLFKEKGREITNKNAYSEELFGSMFFMVISIILTGVNFSNHVKPFMSIATTILSIGFFISALFALKKKYIISRTIIVILCGGMFSFFALTGGNDGFAILWILLVPAIGMLLVGMGFGFILSLYFQIFIIVLFYTPLSSIVKDYYTPNFMLRFPLLYFASFGSNTFLMWQRQLLYKKIYQESYYDALTNLHNRKYYNEVREKIRKEGIKNDLCCFSFDLNHLKYTNDTYGHDAGDELIKATATAIQKIFEGSECFRIGGDEFIVISKDINPQEMINKFKEYCSTYKLIHSDMEISISVGHACTKEDPGLDFDKLTLLADSRMYEEKRIHHSGCKYNIY